MRTFAGTHIMTKTNVDAGGNYIAETKRENSAAFGECNSVHCKILHQCSFRDKEGISNSFGNERDIDLKPAL